MIEVLKKSLPFIFLIIMFTWSFLEDQNPVYLFFILGGIVVIWEILLKNKNYTHKKYYVFIFLILVIQGIILLYMYYFRSLYITNLVEAFFFYLIVALYIWMIVNYHNIYNHREEFVRGEMKPVYTRILDNIKG
ncbi:MAG: hypothetical protein KKF16_05015 [Euryarchaeota archaeon]|nr:hypothetical protein [Euryarchaeota archaeon]MBV1755597.1 hypothetical protein [Methanobacterium sp.]